MDEFEALKVLRIPQPPIKTKTIPRSGFWDMLDEYKWSRLTQEPSGSFSFALGIRQEVLCSGSSPVENRARRELERQKEQYALRTIRQRR